MHRKMFSLLLTLLVLLSAVLPVFADEPEEKTERMFTVTNLAGLEKLAEFCRLDSYSRNLVVVLQSDLDVSDSDFSGIPTFSGRFEGNGHTIRGIRFTREGSVQGFFRYLTDTAVVENLHLQGTVQPGGTATVVGGLVGENSGIIRGCSFDGTVSGKEYIGGIAGESTVTGLIENCKVFGSVSGSHFVGGVVGKNTGSIRSCENQAPVNETSRQNLVELTDITLDSVIHSEAANTSTDVGGIAGNSAGMIRNCTNLATIGYPSMGYNIGGIAGTQSGTVLNCENRGSIYGRKEVGGIVGQMEPTAVMKFEEDVLQILSRQLDGMVQAVNKATSNLEGVGDRIVGQVGDMYGYAEATREAVEALLPTPENPELPDEDALQAARNSIGSNLAGMTKKMKDISATAYSALGKVSSNLEGISDQINTMRNTLGNISEHTGGTVTDRSDEDTEEDLSGKVTLCRNYGSVQGDLNCGGIAGAMALENDLDVQEDWMVTGENSLKFESELRAVILDCENRAVVTTGKQNAGGIVGLQSLGLVKLSRNAGKLNAEKADYVGGVSGRSTGFIRSAYANGEIFGNTYVGGIAGSASIATDCSALVRFGSGKEKLGAILGGREENQTDVEQPISGNYYLILQEDPGAIDGISYDTMAQPLKEDAFFLQENLPDMFRQVTLTFRYGNGMERKFELDFGTSFQEGWIPPIPPRENRKSYWKGLEEADLSAVYFDMVFEQEYTNQTTVLESELVRNDIALLLVQGVFQENARLHVQSADEQPPVEKKEKLLEVWEFQTSEPQQQNQIRLQLPEEADPENIRVLVRGDDGSWRTEKHHVLGRYAVAPLLAGDDAVAVAQTRGAPWLLFAGSAAAVTLAALAVILRKRKKQS